MGSVTSNDNSFVGEGGGEDIHEGGQKGTGDPAGCFHFVLPSMDRDVMFLL